MAPVCAFYHYTPEQFWALNIADLERLVQHMNAAARAQSPSA